MGEEEWRPIPGFPGYDVSDLGRVRSWHNTGARARKGYRSEPVLRKCTPLRGYPGLTLRAGGKYHRRQVHQLVMLAFVGPPGEDQQVRHLDGVRSNVALANLTYGTQRENEADKRAHGTRPMGEAHPMARLTDDQVAAIRLAREGGESCRSIALRYGIAHQHVSDITNGKKRAA